jgi:hypothetical protein
MELKKIPIIDSMFSHAYTSSWYNKSSLMEWDRNIEYGYTFITDPTINVENKKVYVWLLESPAITPYYYEYVKNNSEKFDVILTFDKNILESTTNSKFTPIGGCWIDASDRKIFNKSKLVSLISSGKEQTNGHKFRNSITKRFVDKLDLYGRLHNPIEFKIESLKDYRFQVVVENIKSDFYFTEKIIDCFQTGTIPIYWGCPSIGNFFDSNGIIEFNNLEDLENILNSLSNELYESKLKSITNNFELSKNYLIAEDYIIKNYFKDESF